MHELNTLPRPNRLRRQLLWRLLGHVAQPRGHTTRGGPVPAEEPGRPAGVERDEVAGGCRAVDGRYGDVGERAEDVGFEEVGPVGVVRLQHACVSEGGRTHLGSVTSFALFSFLPKYGLKIHESRTR